jgi:hypothetical protein
MVLSTGFPGCAAPTVYAEDCKLAHPGPGTLANHQQVLSEDTALPCPPTPTGKPMLLPNSCSSLYCRQVLSDRVLFIAEMTSHDKLEG